MYGNGRVGSIVFGPGEIDEAHREMDEAQVASLRTTLAQINEAREKRRDAEDAARDKIARLHEYQRAKSPARPVPYRPGSWRCFCSMWVRGRD